MNRQKERNVKINNFRNIKLTRDEMRNLNIKNVSDMFSNEIKVASDNLNYVQNTLSNLEANLKPKEFYKSYNKKEMHHSIK